MVMLPEPPTLLAAFSVTALIAAVAVAAPEPKATEGAEEYPLPWEVRAMPLTVKLFALPEPVGLVPAPLVVPPEKVMVGAEENPEPGAVMVIEDTRPLARLAVAVAPPVLDPPPTEAPGPLPIVTAGATV